MAHFYNAPMHIHILGICGTFMGGLAVLAKEAGHKVTGCDANVYPPMSTQLREQGIELIEGYGQHQLSLQPDMYVIGNVVSRGNPLMEALLDAGADVNEAKPDKGTTALILAIMNRKWELASFLLDRGANPNIKDAGNMDALAYAIREKHNDVIQKLLRKARKGSKVIYIPGNHDELGRQFINMTFGDIEIKNDLIHTTLDGRRLWVTHGDIFDGVMQYAKWLAYVGDTLYTFILWVNGWFNKIRARMGLNYWSLSQYLKHSVKNAVSFIADFEMIMAREARIRGCDGVVCGHIHKAEIRTIDGLIYCNDGDWVESLTALVETTTGELQIVHWPKILEDQPKEIPQETPNLEKSAEMTV